MGSKGSNTKTTTSTQTYAPNAQVGSVGNQALTMAQTAALQPFQTPAEPVAGFTPDQLQAFNQVRNTQGMAAPWFNQAGMYANQSAQPITAGQIGNYLNPYANYALAGLNDTLGSQNRDLRGNLVQAAGGIGADRVAVGQAEKFRQDQLARGNLMASFYQPALAAAQADKGREANAAYAMGSLGTGAQNASLQGTQALLGTGGLQQQLEQMKLMSPYNQELARIAWPYQNASFLSNIASQQNPVMGGTTSGTATQTSPPPSLLSQITGGLMSGVGLIGGTGGFGPSGWLSGMGGKGAGSFSGNPWGASNYMMPTAGRDFAEGGAVNPADMFKGFETGGMPADTFNDRFGNIQQAPAAVASPFPVFNEDALGLGKDIGVPPEDGNNLPDDALPYAAQPTMGGPFRGLRANPANEAASPYQFPRMPESEMPYPGARATDTGTTMARSPWLALLQAGLATMGGDSPFAGVNIGKGGMEGIKVLQEQRKEARAEESANQAAKRLWQDMQKHVDSYSRMKPYEKAQIDVARERITQEAWKPTGFSTPDGAPILFNSKTGEIKGAAPKEQTAAQLGEPAAWAPEAISSPQSVGDERLKTIVDLSPTVANTFGIQIPKTMTVGERQIEKRGASKIKEEARKSNEGAVQAAGRLIEMREALKDLPDTGFLSPGSWSGARLNIARSVNSLAQFAGVKQPFPAKEVGALEESEKVSTIGGFLQSRLTGGGQHNAAAIIQASMRAYPGAENTPLGAKLIIAAGLEAAQRERDRYEFLTRNEQKFNGNLNAAAVAFDKLNPPEKYISRARLAAVPEIDKKFVLENSGNPAAIAAFNKKYGAGLIQYLEGMP